MRVYLKRKQNLGLSELTDAMIDAVLSLETEISWKRDQVSLPRFTLISEAGTLEGRVHAEPLSLEAWEMLVDEAAMEHEESKKLKASYLFFPELNSDLREAIPRLRALYRPLFERMDMRFYLYEVVEEGEETGIGLEEIVLFEKARPFIRKPQMSQEEIIQEELDLKGNHEYSFYRRARLSEDEMVKFIDLELEFQRLFPK